MQLADHADGFVSADRREISLVAIVKRLQRSSLEARTNVFRRVAALLHRHRRHSRQRATGLVRIVRQIARDVDLRMSWQGEIGEHRKAPHFIGRDAYPLAQYSAEWGSLHSRGPKDGLRGNPFLTVCGLD